MTALRRPRPFSKSGARNFSIENNAPISLLTRGFLPVIDQVTRDPAPSGWMLNVVVLRDLKGFSKARSISTLGRLGRPGDVHGAGPCLAVARPGVVGSAASRRSRVGALQVGINVLPRRPLRPLVEVGDRWIDLRWGCVDGD